MTENLSAFSVAQLHVLCFLNKGNTHPLFLFFQLLLVLSESSLSYLVGLVLAAKRWAATVKRKSEVGSRVSDDGWRMSGRNRYRMSELSVNTKRHTKARDMSENFNRNKWAISTWQKGNPCNDTHMSITYKWHPAATYNVLIHGMMC